MKIAKTNRLRTPDKLPIHMRSLQNLLKLLQVRPRINEENGSRMGYMLNRAPTPVIWEYLEEAKANHRRLILENHPDRGGSHEAAARLNAIWDRARELFRRIGFELP